MNLFKILSHFKVEGTINKIEKIGVGLINSTYKVVTSEKIKPNYILQQINHSVFSNVSELSNNIVRITNHIKTKLKSDNSEKELNRKSLTVIYTTDNKSFYKDIDGNYWRVYVFIEGSKTVEILETVTQAETAGEAFGEFQKLLIDLNNPPLYEVIPNFHNTEFRINSLKESVSYISKEKLDEVNYEVEFLLQLEDEMKSIITKGKQGIIPLRNIHQDAKLSNILFDKNDNALCIIDLDTVMPGYLCYDFGDAVRSGMNTGKEDDENIENISLNLNLFKGFARGYSKATKAFITSEEIDTLAFGAKLLTYEQAVRFLDDYLNGSKYYSTSKPKHNLIRARAQIAYLKNLIDNFQEMDSYVKQLYI